MANIKSAKKRIKVTAKKTMINKIINSRTKTSIKKVLSSVEQGQKDDARENLRNAFSDIDKAAKRGIYHKNKASRRKSRLAKLVNKMA